MFITANSLNVITEMGFNSEIHDELCTVDPKYEAL